MSLEVLAELCSEAVSSGSPVVGLRSGRRKRISESNACDSTVSNGDNERRKSDEGSTVRKLCLSISLYSHNSVRRAVMILMMQVLKGNTVTMPQSLKISMNASTKKFSE